MKKYEKCVLQCHSFRSQCYTKLQYMSFIKSRHGVLESNFSHYQCTAQVQTTGRTTYKYFMVSYFIFAKIALHALLLGFWHVLLFPLAVMTPVLFACLFCSKGKIVVECYTFQSTILQQQF